MAKQQATTIDPALAGAAAVTTGVAGVATGVATHIGGRPNLEDRARAETVRTAGGLTLTVAMVADGIGGNVQGERAAELAIETVFNDVRYSTIAGAAQIPLLLSQALQRANTAVFEEGRADRSRRGMGTTAVLAAVHNNQLYLANVGDSRAYLIRDGQATPITRDHTWAFEMHRQRLLTEAEIAKHPKRHELVRSIGYGSTVDVDLGLYTNGLGQDEREAGQSQGFLLQPNDRLVLCSDGLIKEQRDGAGPFVPGEEMARLVAQHAPQAAAEALVARAIGRQADDNVTAVVMEMPGSKRAVAFPLALLYGLLGLVALLVVGALAFFLLRGGGDEEPPVVAATTATQATVTAGAADASPTLVVAPAGQVSVVAAAGGRWETPDGGGALTAGATIPLPDGQRVKLISDSGATQVALADGSQLFLEAGTEMGLTAGAAGTALELDRGRALVSGGGAPITVGSIVDARAALLGAGLLGLYVEPSSLLFEAACLLGDCEVAGAADGAPLRLPAGQAAVVGSANTAGLPESADFAAYAALAPGLVPQPTATATPTATPTATATATLRPPTLTPRPTATPRPTTAPVVVTPVETDTPRSDDPAPTDRPPEATDTPALPTQPPPEPVTSTPDF